MDWSEAETLRPGDEVTALSKDGPLPMRVLSGPVQDGEFEILWLCDAKDWDTLQSGGEPGDEWDEWRVPWPLGALRRPSLESPSTALELDEYLHDAWIDLNKVTEEFGVVVVRGLVEKPIQTRQDRLGRFPFTLRVQGQLTAVEDEEGIGLVPIESVTYADGVFRIEGAIPGCVVIATSAGTGGLTVASEAVEERRWLRWRPIR